MNRAERRRLARMEASASSRNNQLMKAAFTQDARNAEYNRGFNEGKKAITAKVTKAYYSATMIALHEEFGFGTERAMRALHAIETNFIKYLTDEELVKAAEKQLKITINTDEGINMAQPL